MAGAMMLTVTGAMIGFGRSSNPGTVTPIEDSQAVPVLNLGPLVSDDEAVARLRDPASVPMERRLVLAPSLAGASPTEVAQLQAGANQLGPPADEGPRLSLAAPMNSAAGGLDVVAFLRVGGAQALGDIRVDVTLTDQRDRELARSSFDFRLVDVGPVDASVTVAALLHFGDSTVAAGDISEISWQANWTYSEVQISAPTRAPP